MNYIEWIDAQQHIPREKPAHGPNQGPGGGNMNRYIQIVRAWDRRDWSKMDALVREVRNGQGKWMNKLQKLIVAFDNRNWTEFEHLIVKAKDDIGFRAALQGKPNKKRTRAD